MSPLPVANTRCWHSFSLARSGRARMARRAFPYLITYHTLTSFLLRRVNKAFTANGGDDTNAATATGWTFHNIVAVGVFAYITAVLEAWSIGSFPGYWYPDTYAMLTKGSAFYVRRSACTCTLVGLR